jgi:hypothetical protein
MAVEIFEQVGVTGTDDTGMLTRDQLASQDDVTRFRAAEHNPIGPQRHLLH